MFEHVIARTLPADRLAVHSGKADTIEGDVLFMPFRLNRDRLYFDEHQPGGRRNMEKAVEEHIRVLARPLWESAARPYGMAMDFWLMAEQMVLEMMAATARMQDKAISPPPLPRTGELPSAVPVAKVRALAECMWDSAGRQYGIAQDYWLAAERHVLTMMRAASVWPPHEKAEPWAAELSALEPSAYLQRIRLMAYNYWEKAGRRYGQALDCWLHAEREFLSMLVAAAESNAPGYDAAMSGPSPTPSRARVQ